VATFPGEVDFRFNIVAGVEFALRLGLGTRLLDLETNKDRRAGFMFKAPSARDYWRSQKTSSTAARMMEAGSIAKRANVDVVSMNRNNRPTIVFGHNNKTRRWGG
jgi:hypothetical protein